jgi:cytochrome c oxidase subunit 4
MKPLAIRHLLLAWGALLVLLGLTLGSAFVPMGPWNGVVNYAVAFAKAAIVMIVFMHATRSGTFVRLLAVTGLVWLLIMATLGLSDYGTRGPADAKPPPSQQPNSTQSG